MALSDERIDDLAQNYGLDWVDYEPFARAIEAEARKDDEAELEAIKSDLNDYMAAANAEADLATELLEQKTQDTALILQLVEALEVPARDVCRVAHHKKQDRHEYGDACPLQARHDAAIVAGRAWLEGKPCA